MPGKRRQAALGALGGKRLVLLLVAGLLTGAAGLAVGILLFGDFGATEGRILATTGLLAGYGLLTLPAAILRDQGRQEGLALAVVVLATAAAALASAAVWNEEPPEALGKTIGTVNGWLLASVQVSALALRRRDRDPRFVRLLFVVSSALVVVLAGMFTAIFWAELDSAEYGRAFGALLVLDVLLVALQPILARARTSARVHRLRIGVAAEGTLEMDVEAPDLAAAASKAIKRLEDDGRRVLYIEFTGRLPHANGAGFGDAQLMAPAGRASAPGPTDGP